MGIYSPAYLAITLTQTAVVRTNFLRCDFLFGSELHVLPQAVSTLSDHFPGMRHRFTILTASAAISSAVGISDASYSIT